MKKLTQVQTFTLLHERGKVSMTFETQARYKSLTHAPMSWICAML